MAVTAGGVWQSRMGPLACQPPWVVGARPLCRQAQGEALGWAGDACPMLQGGQHVPGAATP